jgi:thiamine biosynthesis protein ThiS
MSLSEPTLVEILVNGERKAVPAGLSVSALLRHFELDPATVAVELDRRIVRKTAWDHTGVAAGATLEIVQFVGGG